MQLVKDFAEPDVVPINASLFAHHFLDFYVRDLKKDIDDLSMKIPQIKQVITQYTNLLNNAKEFVRVADAFQKSIRDNKFNAWTLNTRSINDRLMAMERCFVGPEGLPGSPERRNVLFSVSASNSYAGKVMPGVYDQLEALSLAKTENERDQVAKLVVEQISHVQYGVQCATHTLGIHF
ncbi:unnamed protein product [Bursaphelenchus okinawaensis]|uniref:Transferrin receptor-like dimerisation domain-containing protein n=1 Tax=Bursaphelenchus okinawaensis TaxID=465554 RepID=A0A811LPK1_9BILA|nr:unnamed protein product [Bursaphelenchus okinawaensis]CAG9127207.1 unnamed protein product [Bursaphelenchus okinawaensis]